VKPQASYRGIHAAIYDALYAAKPYAEEAAFVARRFAAHGVAPGARLLDLACGTGSHALALAALGYDVTGIDNSVDMLARAISKVPGPSARVRFTAADLPSINLGEARFEAATCLFNSIGYLRTDMAIRSTFERVHSALSGAGMLFIEFWHAPAMIAHHEPLRVRRLETPRGEIVRIAETSIDREASVAQVAYSIYDLDRAGHYSRHDEVQVNRFFTQGEMDRLLTAGGFRALEWFAGFSESAALDERAFSLTVLAKAETKE
jgi:SAM-dependent methyltransferase